MAEGPCEVVYVAPDTVVTQNGDRQGRLSRDTVLEAPNSAVAVDKEVIVSPERDLASQAPEDTKSVADSEASSLQTQNAEDAVQKQVSRASAQANQRTTATGKKL